MPKRIPTGNVFRKAYKSRQGETRHAKTWTIKYSVNGKACEEATGSEDYEEALALLRNRMARATKSIAYSEQVEKVTVGQLLDLVIQDYQFSKRASLYDTEKRVEKNLRPFFGHRKAVDVTTRLLRDYIASRHAESSTINKELSWLRRAFKLGYQNEPRLVDKIPYIKMLPVDNARSGIVTDPQYRVIRDALPTYARIAMVIGYHTGARKGEIRKIRVDSIDPKAKRIELTRKTTKNKTPRYLPIYGDMAAELDMAISAAKRDGCAFIVQSDGKPVFDFEKAWHTACRFAGVDSVLFHDLRRTAVTNMIEAGFSEKEAMEISGHKTRSMLDRYHIVSERRMKQLGERMEKHMREKALDAQLDKFSLQ
jgi:integrase